MPKKIKQKLSEYEEKWPQLPVKWTDKNNLHITMIFLGNVKEEKLGKICEAIESFKKEPFPIKLTRVRYAPVEKIPPRMIWAVGEKSDKLSSLKNNMDESLSGEISFRSQRKSFVPHITLGRIRKWQWREMEEEERPQVEENISLNFEVNSVELMNSVLKRKGPQYETLQSFTF